MSSRYDKRAVWSWALYDFANSSFTTLVVTFIYATYFTKFIAPPSEADAIGTALWSRGVTITAIAVAVMSPFVGALADRGGFRKLFLMITTVVCVIGTVMLYFPLPFESAAVGGAAMEALFWFVIANVFFELGGVFYNAFLPDIAPPDRIGRISGYGWGLGYIGGLVCMFLALFVFVQAEEPVFGLLTKEAGQHVRATNLLVAGWFAIFALPLFFFVKEDRSKATQQKSRIFADTVSQLKRTFTEIRDYRQVVRFLVARMIYNDGLVTVFAFGGIFAQGAFDFTTEDVLMLGIVLNITAGIGALSMGYLDDKLGGKRTIQITLIGLIAATLIAIVAPSRTWFWVAAIGIGIFVGPNQSASRSLLGRFVPPDKENEFYGFFAFSGKATAFLGPLLYGILVSTFGTQQAGISAVLLMFVVGGLLLFTVDEKEGIAKAGRMPVDPSDAP